MTVFRTKKAIHKLHFIHLNITLTLPIPLFPLFYSAYHYNIIIIIIMIKLYNRHERAYNEHDRIIYITVNIILRLTRLPKLKLVEC